MTTLNSVDENSATVHTSNPTSPVKQIKKQTRIIDTDYGYINVYIHGKHLIIFLLLLFFFSVKVIRLWKVFDFKCLIISFEMYLDLNLFYRLSQQTLMELEILEIF